MDFVKQASLQDPAVYLAGAITRNLLAGKKILWFLSGGSSINIAVATRKLLSADMLSGLTVTLGDERYGPEGHKDSNWQQLKLAGFDFRGLKLLPVLSGTPIKATTEKFAKILNQELAANQLKIGLLGIGADGHTAGILPGSPALDSLGLAASYQAPDFQRITITPRLIKVMDEAVVSLSGNEKRRLIDKLGSNEPASSMPAQLLKLVPKCVIFNGWIGGKA